MRSDDSVSRNSERVRRIKIGFQDADKIHRMTRDRSVVVQRFCFEDLQHFIEEPQASQGGKRKQKV